MAFAYTKTWTMPFGNKKMVTGTFTNGAGDSGGDIVTGLTKIDYCGASNETTAAKNAKLAVSGGTIRRTTARRT